jgi:hypothetical protein
MSMTLWLDRLRAIGKRPPPDRDCDRAAFRPEDGIDELFAGANPNPQRAGCPENHVLQAAARRALPMKHEVYEHLANCSECYREFRVIQEPNARRLRSRAAVGAAAALAIVGIGAATLGRGLTVAPGSRVPQAIVLDYRNEGVNRSDAGDAKGRVVALPRKNIVATILMPTGSEPGRYEMRVVDQDGHVWFSQAATGIMANFAVSLKANLDLRALAQGSYFLETRGTGDDWDAHPISVQ